MNNPMLITCIINVRGCAGAALAHLCPVADSGTLKQAEKTVARRVKNYAPEFRPNNSNGSCRILVAITARIASWHLILANISPFGRTSALRHSTKSLRDSPLKRGLNLAGCPPPSCQGTITKPAAPPQSGVTAAFGPGCGPVPFWPRYEPLPLTVPGRRGSSGR
jgi:hypothetical protein